MYVPWKKHSKYDVQLSMKVHAKSYQSDRRCTHKLCAAGHEVLLYMGIIDILQEYDWSKKLEHAYKSIQSNPLSCIQWDSSIFSTRNLFWAIRAYKMLTAVEARPVLVNIGVVWIVGCHIFYEDSISRDRIWDFPKDAWGEYIELADILDMIIWCFQMIKLSWHWNTYGLEFQGTNIITECMALAKNGCRSIPLAQEISQLERK